MRTALALLLLWCIPSLAAVGFNSQPVYGRVGWWPMNDASGTSVLDKSGFAGTLAVTNSSGWGNGVALSGWTITASNAVSEAADNDIHDIKTGSFTVMCWFNCGPQAAAGAAIITKTITAQEKGRWSMDLNIFAANTLSFSVITNATQGTTVIASSQGGIATFTNSTWNQAVGVVDRSSNLILLYTNGVLANSAGCLWLTLDLNSTNRLRIGAYGSTTGTQPSFALNGTVDDARIYNRALSAEEIKLLYNGRKTAQR